LAVVVVVHGTAKHQLLVVVVEELDWATLQLALEPQVQTVKVILEATATHMLAHSTMEQAGAEPANVAEMQVMPVLVMATVVKDCVFLSQALLYFMLAAVAAVVNLLVHILDWVDKAAAAVVDQHRHPH
jgi:hypothetical protein